MRWAAIALSLILPSSAFAAQGLADFFPSVPIHEDDTIEGVYELVLDDCRMTVTERDGSTLRVSMFDLRDFETDPRSWKGPRLGTWGVTHSTRYVVLWQAKNSVMERRFTELAKSFGSMRLSARDTELAPERLRAKAADLKAKRLDVSAGEFGPELQRNHTLTYRLQGVLTEMTSEVPLLVHISPEAVLQLPAELGEHRALIDAVHRHGETCAD